MNSIGNGEAKEIICMTHGYGLRWVGMWEGDWEQTEGNKGEGKIGTTVIA